MSERKIIHATLVKLDGKGILLIGKSGSGKSDLALRLIENKKASLVADDIVDIVLQNGKLVGSVPQNLAGLLEVRNIGIIKYPYIESSSVDMLVNLTESSEEIERMPSNTKDVILGLEINKIDLYAKESSAADKVVAALRKFGQNTDERNG